MSEPKQARARLTRDEVVHAAAEVFDERGYSGASMREITKRAGVTLGAVYFHFDSKEALARAVMKAQPDSIMPRLTSEGLQRLVDLTLVWSQQLQTDRVLRAGVRLTNEQTSFGMHDATPYVDWARIMEECLIAARERGELLDGIDPRDTSELLVAACTGIQMYAHVINSRADLPARTVKMWRLLLPAVAVTNMVKKILVGPSRLSELNAQS